MMKWCSAVQVQLPTGENRRGAHYRRARYKCVISNKDGLFVNRGRARDLALYLQSYKNKLQLVQRVCINMNLNISILIHNIKNKYKHNGKLAFQEVSVCYIFGCMIFFFERVPQRMQVISLPVI